MTLGIPLVLAILFAALLHAGWNALIKSGGDKSLDTALVHSLGVLFAIPAAIWFGLPVAAAWPYIVASWTIHVAYYIALAGAYRHGDLGLTYPIMRGTAPMLVALVGAIFVGERLSGQAWTGVCILSAGVLMVGLARVAGTPGGGQHRGKALGFALANACIIAAYTVIDGMGVRASGDAFSYAAAIFLFDGLPYTALVLWQAGPRRREALGYMRRRAPLAIGGTAASLGSYSIALWAMTHAPVALVAALRETSVIFAALIGTLLLGERFGWVRAAGTGLVVVGVATLRFS
ncbi:EamA family transporter [Xylophilus rhododendri]|uniref:EamA family transporter n=1 Tax=Xylophilus rhododendri TaxID=2697032 RepID=A0A857JD00_9BURK|nr:EamA family transporter [Xylophilus rhododendri]QHJ01084.1 EamA family transporter [Xylophilus rhododendri]